MAQKQKVTGLMREVDGKTEILCPWCATWQLRSEYKQYTINPEFMAHQTPILQCQCENEHGEPCRHLFAPTVLALQMRQEMLDSIEQ